MRERCAQRIEEYSGSDPRRYLPRLIRALPIAANDARHQAMRQEYEERFKRLEGFQSRLLGAFALALVCVPALTGVLVYLLTK